MRTYACWAAPSRSPVILNSMRSHAMTLHESDYLRKVEVYSLYLSEAEVMVKGQPLSRGQKALIRSLRKRGWGVKQVIKFCSEDFEDPFHVSRQTITKTCSFPTLDAACAGPGHTKKFRGHRDPLLSSKGRSRTERRIRAELRSEDLTGDQLRERCRRFTTIGTLNEAFNDESWGSSHQHTKKQECKNVKKCLSEYNTPEV
eukprot:3541245-Lingulodinium_polyedra.AAC.1